jgi:ferredoxin--NADP+ reductase
MPDSKPGTPGNPLRVAVVGSGPSGFYAAVALLKQTDHEVTVDMFDRLPTPFGLVRGGVAPDHQKIKSVARVYDKTAQAPEFRFFGNVRLGEDIQVDDLKRHYHQIVYAVGNESDRRMGVPGEELRGVSPATVFVGWYNAHPDYRDAEFDWSSKTVAVVGNGNVAIDVVRILAKQHDELAPSDIAQHALDELKHSDVEEIVVLGRRGPVQAAFTPQEIKELAELPSAQVVVSPQDLEMDEHSRKAFDEGGPKSSAQRNYAVLENVETRPDARRRIRFRFLVSPVEFVGDDNGRVRAIRVEKNRLVPRDDGSLKAEGTGEHEEIPADWVFVSIGYEGQPIPGVPFDERRGTIANEAGRVCDASDRSVVPNQYVVGWAQSGPRGLIGIHKGMSADVVTLMLEDLAAGTVGDVEAPSSDAVPAMLAERGVEYVTFDDWKKIDAAETERGAARGAPRVKFARVLELLRAAGKSSDA